jgi:hypothetical protein
MTHWQKLRQRMCKSCSIIHSFILVLLLIVGAGADMQSNGLPSEYFPLKTGLYWKYQYKGMPRQPVEVDVRITEEKIIEGKNYFHFSTWFNLTRSASEGDTWIAWQDGVIYRWDGKNETNILAPLGKQIELTKDRTGMQIETPAGKFSDVYRFHDCPGCADAGTEFIFARNVGIVSVSMSAIWGGASYELIETNANTH